MATSSPAWFFDGKSSERRMVRVRFDQAGWLHVEGLESPRVIPMAKLEIPSRLGNTPRAIRLPDGAMCEVENNDLVDEALARQNQGKGAALLSGLEASNLAAFLALLVLGGVVWWGMVWGIPLAADRVASHLPARVEQDLGHQAIQEMESLALFESSKLDKEEFEPLTAAFQRVVGKIQGGERFQLLFRKSKSLGANAFALPGGIIVLTDDLARLFENMDEAESIFAHEAGHLVRHHTLRQILQGSATTLLIITLSGDISSLTALTATLPSFFLNAHFSREFEAEADHFAMEYMKDTGLPSSAFINILARLEKNHGGSLERSTHYLDSHPATAERIASFKQMSPPAK